MAGRHKQPVDLLLVKGKKHLTKAEIEKRKSEEIKAPADKIRAPSFLPPKLKREFHKLAKQLVALHVVTNLDVDALAKYVMTRQMYMDVTLKMLADPMAFDKAIAAQQDKLFKQLRAAESDFGLNPTARCKLTAPKQEKKTKSAMEDFLERRAGGRHD